MKNSVPKSQSYPASIIRVGAILYEAVAYTKDDGSVVSGVDEWVVRSVRARRNSLSRDGVKFPSFAAPPKMVNLYQRNEFTWIKALGKSSSYDWAPSIWSGYKRQFAEGSNLPGGIYTTKICFSFKKDRSRLRLIKTLSKSFRRIMPMALCSSAHYSGG